MNGHACHYATNPHTCYNTVVVDISSNGGSMEIAANRLLGQLVFDVVRGRATEKGYDVPHAAIPDLGEYMQRVSREIALTVLSVQAKVDSIEKIMDETRPPEWALNFARLDPIFNAHLQTFMAMSFASHLTGKEADSAAWVFTAIDDFLQRKGLRPLDDEECVALPARAVEFAAQQQPTGTLGAAGGALFFTTTSHLKGLAVGRTLAQKARRRKFRQSLHELCLEIETVPGLAERKAKASWLGEMLEKELRASGAEQRTTTMAMFWDEFNLFFGVQSLPQYYKGKSGETPS